jgi:hypothetical protein
MPDFVSSLRKIDHKWPAWMQKPVDQYSENNGLAAYHNNPVTEISKGL